MLDGVVEGFVKSFADMEVVSFTATINVALELIELNSLKFKLIFKW